jgi:Na+/H+ antiporter NhaD/arsenite permease-like protein
MAAVTTDPTSRAIVAMVLGTLFALLTLEKAHRVLVALTAVALLWAISYLTPWRVLTLETAHAALDLNVLLLLAGMMALVGVLKATGVFDWAAVRMLRGRAHLPMAVLGSLLWGTGVASAFLDNVTTVIFVVPIALGIATRLGVDARALLLPIVMAANVGGTATLIGDPPNIMVGSAAGLTFVAFLATTAPPVLLMMVLLHRLVRRRYGNMLEASTSGEAIALAVPAIADPRLLRGMTWIGGGVLLGFLTHGATGMPAAVPAVIGAAAALILQDQLYLQTHRPSPEERRHGILGIIEHEIEWPTLVFFALLFILVGAAVETGLMAALAHGLETAIFACRDALGLGPTGTLVLAAVLVLWVAGVLSALIDNIPFVAVSLPVIASLSANLASGSMILWWALALGACLGGNGSPIGASANVTTLDLAARQGVRTTFREFLALGVPVVLMTLGTATLWIVTYVTLGNRIAAPASLALALLLWVSGRRSGRLRTPVG